jgi:hypothetical protein
MSFVITHTNPKIFTIAPVTGAPNGVCSSLVAVPYSGTQILLTWANGSTNETSISIQCAPLGGTYSNVHKTIGGVTSYLVDGLTIGTKYYFKVRPFRGNSAGNYSNIASATTYCNECINYVTRVTADGGTVLSGADGSYGYLNEKIIRFKTNGFYTSASILTIPSGIKSGKIYSILPIDGSGDWVFSRASSKWLEDSTGVFTERVTNMPGLRWNGTEYEFISEPAVSNLFTNPSAPVTQDIVVNSSETYGISCKGTGTVYLTGALTAVVTELTPYVGTSSGTSLHVSCTGTLTHVQVENSGGFISSPIYGGAGVHSRQKDVANLTSITSLIGQTEGTPYVELSNRQTNPSPAGVVLSLNDGTTNNRLDIVLNKDTNGYRYGLTMVNGGGTQIGFDGQYLSTLASTLRMGVGYKINDSSFYINGICQGTDTVCTIPAMSEADLGCRLASAQFCDGLTVYGLSKTRLTDAQLQVLTNNPPTAGVNDISAQCVVNANYNISFSLKGKSGDPQVIINWGDEHTSTLTMDGASHTLSHTYTKDGTYNTLITNTTSLLEIDMTTTGNNPSFGADVSVFNVCTQLEKIILTASKFDHGDVDGWPQTLKEVDISDIVETGSQVGGTMYLPNLELLLIFGRNTIAGNIALHTKLIRVFLSGYCTFGGDITPCTAMVQMEKGGLPWLNTSYLFGTIAPSTNFICVNAPNKLGGDITANNFKYLSLADDNEAYGDVSGWTNTYYLGHNGIHLLTGTLSQMTRLQYYNGGDAFTKLTRVNNMHQLCNFHMLASWLYSSAEINQILADFRANEDYPKVDPIDGFEYGKNMRYIYLDGYGSEPATGQGGLDLNHLRSYHSPNDDPQYDVWTIYTNL